MTLSVSPLRVLVVTTVHHPLDARIHHRQIRAMLHEGWSVTYAAPFRDTGTSPGDLAPGVTIADLPRAVGRRRLKALLAARRLIKRTSANFDVVLIHDPELILAVLGRMRRAPTVLDVHEDLASSVMERTYLPRWSRGILAIVVRRVEGWIEDRLGLLLAEHQYRRRFVGSHPVVRNLPWRRQVGASAQVGSKVLYVGRLSEQRGVRELIELGRRLVDVGGPEVVLIGPADEEVAGLLESATQAGFVRWRGFLPNEVALAETEGALAGLSLLHDTPNYRVSLPTKILEYLSCGVPVITTPLPEAVEVVETSGAGAVVPFGSVDEVVRTIMQWCHDPVARRVVGERAVRAGLKFSWDEERHVMLDALRARAESRR